MVFNIIKKDTISKLFTLLFLIISSTSHGQCPAGPPNTTIACGASTTLAATTSFTNYSIINTPCTPVAISGTNAFPTACDDCVTGQIPIGFPFNFYGIVYNTAVISTNGLVGFGPFTFTGYTPFTIPAGGTPDNYIAGIMCDIDIRYGGTITYQTVGVAPNRRFVVSYNAVVPYNSGSSAGTGTASFQIVLNENNSFNVIISQYSANWNASNTTGLATSGAENIDGTYAFPVPGRNAQDFRGIVPGNQDCRLFNPAVCTFLRWEIAGTTVSTSANYTVSPTATTTYTAVWNCGGTTCTANTIVTINTGLSLTSSTNSTDCATPNGAMVFNANLANGTYTLNYTLNGTPTSTSIAVASNSFTLSNLNAGTYNNFTIGSGACASSYSTPVVITSPPTPTTTGLTICQGGSGTISSSSTCGPVGTVIAPSTTFNSGSLTAGGPTIDRPNSWGPCSTSGSGYYYSAYPFTVTTPGSYTFNGCFPTSDGYGVLFQNAFNPLSPCDVPANFVTGNDDSNPLCGADPTFTATLATGITYYIISTTFSSGVTDTYSWDFTGPGNIVGGSGTPGVIQWYTAATGGSAIGTGSPFNPVGVAGSGLANTNTPGTYTYYAACSGSPTCRTATTFVITANSTAPTAVTGTGTFCNGTTATLGRTGGTLVGGASWEWFSGSCGGTFLGTGATLPVTPVATTTYFVRASAAGGCAATACASGTITLPTAGTALANNTESATCVVNQNGYIHFYHSSGRLICSINSQGQNLGTVNVTAYTGSPVDMPACNFPSMITTALGRHWVITPQFQPTTAINVALHFDQSEFTALTTQANANTNPQDNVSTIGNLLLSKYSGPLNVDASVLNNCPAAGGSGGTTIHNQAANGNTATMLPGFSATARFSRHDITSCSEFWLHGQTNLSPLATELVSMSGDCQDDGSVKISWTTASENNCVKYSINRYSELEDSWQEIHNESCSISSYVEKNYLFIDNTRNSEATYYQLVEEDVNGTKTIIQTIQVSCATSNNTFTIFPNPAQNNFAVQIKSTNSIKEATILITDLSGKIIDSKYVTLNNGTTNVPFSTSDYSAGSYLVYLQETHFQLAPLKLIVKK